MYKLKTEINSNIVKITNPPEKTFREKLIKRNEKSQVWSEDLNRLTYRCYYYSRRYCCCCYCCYCYSDKFPMLLLLLLSPCTLHLRPASPDGSAEYSI